MIIDFCSYNVRGLNKKQIFVKDFLSLNKISLVALLETHVKKDAAPFVSKHICPRFNWVFNYDHHINGRIWVGFDPSIWNLNVLCMSAQQITCSVLNQSSGDYFVVSFIYAFNTAVERRSLWSELLSFKQHHIVNNEAWCLSGDFNVCLGPDEASNGVHWNTSMRDFYDFLNQAEIMDLRCSGPFYTWWDCNLMNPVYKRLDRCLVNVNWLGVFDLSQAQVLMRGLSDHCPMAVSLGKFSEKIYKPFHFFNHLIEVPGFLDVVRKAWQLEDRGNPWFVLTSKLKRVKVAMRNLNRKTGHLSARVEEERNALYSYQSALPMVPSRAELSIEGDLIKNLQKSLELEEVFLKQKSRVSWLQCGDSNNKFFFNSCKNRWNQNKILTINDDQGNSFTSHSEISRVAVDYFSSLMGQSSSVGIFPDNLSLPMLSDQQREELIKPFTAGDIWNVLKGMPRNKCPGPDGFSVEFFIAAWNIVGKEVCNGILYFFSTRQLPRIINSTALALVPKVSPSMLMSDFRPIACCNIIYKCITKLLAMRMKKLLPSLISLSQSAFIPNRVIGDNILLAQALFKNYHLNSGAPRCAMKIDIKKAFDTLNWDFLAALQHMGFSGIV